MPSSSSPSLSHRYSSIFLLLLIILCGILSSPVSGSSHHRHKKAPTVASQEEDYDYRIDQDYSQGVFIDAVPMAKTEKEEKRPKEQQEKDAEFQRTNRYPSKKLRKFVADSNARREWMEALFTQRRRRRR